jgi:hypothetical protein
MLRFRACGACGGSKDRKGEVMFGGKKKLYAEGAQTEGQVFALTEYTGGYAGSTAQGVKVRVKFPDGSVTEFEKGPLSALDVGYFAVGSVVPVRYDPADHSKVVLDIPALKERHAQTGAAQQAQLDAQFAHMGEPGSPGLVGGGDLKAQLLQMAAQNPGSVIDLRSSQPQAEQASDPVDRLSKLAELKQQGVLTEEEFTAAKAKILGES